MACPAMKDALDELRPRDVPSMNAMEIDDRLGLVETMQELRRRYGRAPAYNQLWHAIAQGQIEAERVGGRWKVSRADVPRITAALGIAAAAAA